MKRFVVAAVIVALVLMAGMAQAAIKADPTGTWKWTVKFNDQEREMTLKLKLEDGKLTGAMVGRNRETAIEDGQFKDGEVSFKVSRERNGVKMTTKYCGKLDGDEIKGKTETERDGKAQSRDWVAKRAK